MHVLRAPFVGDEGDDAAVAPACEDEPRFLPDLPQQTVLRAFALLNLAADADPFVLVFVHFLFHPVEHQVVPAPFQVAQRGVSHAFFLRSSHRALTAAVRGMAKTMPMLLEMPLMTSMAR